MTGAQVTVHLPALANGECQSGWVCTFYDTQTGQRQGSKRVAAAADNSILLPLPDFNTSVAFRMTATTTTSCKLDDIAQVTPYFGRPLISLEAENLTATSDGWVARRWGEGNYFAASTDNVFMSRMAYLQAPANVSKMSAITHA